MANSPTVGINVHFSNKYSPVDFTPDIRLLTVYDGTHVLQLGPVSNFVTLEQLTMLRDALTSYLAQIEIAQS